MARITPFPVTTQSVSDPWPFSVNATVAAGLLAAFWFGLLVGFIGVKGGLL